MKSFIFLLTFILLPAELLYTQDSWHKQFYDSTIMLTYIYFINENTGWAVGYTGNIVHTSDGGETWISQTSGTIDWLNCVYFIDSNTGFISGYGFILKTINSGLNWDKINIDTLIDNKKFEFFELYFSCIDTGYLLGAIKESFSDDAFWRHWYFVKSDGGLKSFEMIDKGKDDYWAKVQFYYFYFHNRNLFHEEKIGYKLKRYTLSKTYDDGVTWKNIGGFISIFFVNPQVGYAIGSHGFTIFKTTSGGE